MSNPYKYTRTEDGNAYHFTTDRNITYIFYFRLASEHLEETLPFRNDIYDFSFEPIGEKPKEKDARIEDTIINVISNLLLDKSRVLLYICESIDEKHLYRKRLFDNWFNRYGSDEITKIDFEIEESKAIGSIIISQENPNINQIRAFLEDRVQEYRSWKS